MRSVFTVPSIVLFLISFAIGCSSALKKTCESTNWFEHGEMLAKSGQRVNSDTFLQQCDKEEAAIDHARLSQGFRKGQDEYCTVEYAFRLGKQGEFLSADMCAGNPAERNMKLKHAEGVREYCDEGNGIAAGATGKKYNKICPKELEKAFLVEFNKGRKRYLSGFIARREGEVQDIDRDVRDLERRKSDVQNEIRRLDYNKAALPWYGRKKSNGTSPVVFTPEEDRVMKERQRLDSEIDRLRGDMARTDRDLEGKRAQQRTLLKELREAQGELATF